MVNYSCPTCDKSFKQKGHYDFHMKRKTPCKKNEEQVNTIIKKLNVGLFEARSYDDVKTHYDTVLNKDKGTFKSSNDEPTPIGCIEEMLEQIPMEFWQKKDVKILDPCCGNGNFHFVIANKLRLSKNSGILHFNDINVDRLENVKTIFRDPIVTNKDFLKEDFASDYDMIVGNPPYALLMEDGSRASKNHSISSLFIKKSIDCLKDCGYLVYIVPDNWMSLSDRNKFCELLTSYQFIKLSIHKAKSWFPKVGSSFTWFVLQKTPGLLPFTVEYLHKKIVNVSTVTSQVTSYIPLFHSKHTQSIFRKTVDSTLQKYNVETSSDLHKYTKKNYISSTADDVFKYKLIHTPKQTVWSNRPHKFQDGWKVFISTTDTYNVFIDNCGMTQSIAFIKVDNEEAAKKITTQLLSPLYRFINNACRYGNFNNIRILQKLPISIENPYVEFGITPDEITYINSHL